MNAYIITLPKDPRLANAETLKRQLPIPTEIVQASLPEDAYDYMSLKRLDQERSVRKKRFRLYAGIGNSLNPGEYGCAHSHLRVWKMIAENKSPALIFEDDSIIIENSADVISNFIQEIQFNEDWNKRLIYLGAFRNISETRQPIKGCESLIISLFRFLLSSRLVRGPIVNLIYSSLWNKIKNPQSLSSQCWNFSGLHDGTHGYYCSPEAAEILIKINEDLYFPSDTAIKYAVFFDILTAGVLKQFVVTQKSMKSTIDPNRDYRNLLNIT
jgi:GR25 family glycosyltransferase involved in LPS biosynthesis